jgi:RNA polymerase sigma-70 factor (ECF subfamily)
MRMESCRVEQPGDNAGWSAAQCALPGSADWLRTQWQEHRRWVAAILLAHKPAWADVDDLLQEVATALVRKGADLRDPHSVRPWLRTVAINAAHAAARAGNRRGRVLSLDRDSDSTGIVSHLGLVSPPAQVEVREGGSVLLRLAAKIPEGYREPLLLKAVQGMSYRQIGVVMGLPETTVETRIARARKMLRELAETSDSIRSESATERVSARINMGDRITSGADGQAGS